MKANLMQSAAKERKFLADYPVGQDLLAVEAFNHVLSVWMDVSTGLELIRASLPDPSKVNFFFLFLFSFLFFIFFFSPSLPFLASFSLLFFSFLYFFFFYLLFFSLLLFLFFTFFAFFFSLLLFLLFLFMFINVNFFFFLMFNLIGERRFLCGCVKSFRGYG